jgi:hypothetical protein
VGTGLSAGAAIGAASVAADLKLPKPDCPINENQAALLPPGQDGEKARGRSKKTWQANYDNFNPPGQSSHVIVVGNDMSMAQAVCVPGPDTAVNLAAAAGRR